MSVSLVSKVARPISSALSSTFSMDAMGKLDAYGKLGAWSPLSLFAASEVGAWYDPSDLTTMFQDRAGTTQVTADGQTVGIILDNSKGSYGSNFISSPDSYAFTPGGTTPPTITNTIYLGESCKKFAINLSGAGGYSVCRAIGDIASTATVPNILEKMQVRFALSRALVGDETITFYVQATQAPLKAITSSSPSSQWIDLSATGFRISTGGLNIAMYTSGTFTGGALDVYARQFVIADWIGNHAVAPSDAARPLKTSTGAADWTNYDAVDDVINSTFPSSLGSSCTVCRANVGAAPTILTAQTIGASYADSTDHAGLIIINRALTTQETTDVTAWLLAKGAA